MSIEYAAENLYFNIVKKNKRDFSIDNTTHIATIVNKLIVVNCFNEKTYCCCNYCY